jgi:hypothetical protein
MVTGSLTIERLKAECELAGTPREAAALHDRAARILGHELESAVERRWRGSGLDRTDESVWIVRRVDLSVCLNGESAADTLATGVAESLGRALDDTLVGDGDGRNAIRFENPAAYLRQLLLDLASGGTVARWYYAPFGGLAALPISGALRTVLLADPERGRAALAGLSDADLSRVCAALTADDEERVLDGLAGSGPQESSDAALAAAWAGFERARRAGSGRPLFALVRAPGAMPVVAAMRRLLALVKASRNGTPGPALWSRAAIHPVVGDAPNDAADWSDIPAPIRQALAAPGNQGETGAARYSLFGGVFLLLRHLDELPWSEWTEGWPAPLDVRANAALKWMTACLCTGREQSARALDDPVLRAILGISDTLAADDLRRWLRRVGARRHRMLRHAMAGLIGRCPAGFQTWTGLPPDAGVGAGWVVTLGRVAVHTLRRFAGRLPGFADSSPSHLWHNLLGFDAAVEWEADRVVVRCGRPPLQLLLSVTGMTRGSLAGHDPMGRPIHLFPRE